MLADRLLRATAEETEAMKGGNFVMDVFHIRLARFNRCRDFMGEILKEIHPWKPR
jgi:hypothetical protein